MRKWAILIGALGTLGLLAALHHVVVITARGTTFSNAFAPTCQACHGNRYDGFGNTALKRPDQNGEIKKPSS